MDAINTIGTWVGGVGTVGAFVVAFWILLKQRNSETETAERLQASLVSAWLDLGNVKGHRCVRLLARNSSPSQINDFMGSIADTANPTKAPTVIWFPGLPPTGEPTISAVPVPMPTDQQSYRYELTYEFTDVFNRRWRHERGTGLVLITRTPSAPKYKQDGSPGIT
jgi:hypothetical protein